MIKRIVHFALNQPLFIIFGLVLFIGVGVAAFRSLPIPRSRSFRFTLDGRLKRSRSK